MPTKLFERMGAPTRPIASEFHALHMLRLLCAVGIMTGHWGDHYYERLLPQGQLPIDLFFLLEGFLTAHLLLGIATDKPAGKLVGRKFIEIYPLYVTGLLLGLFVTAIFGEASGEWSTAGLMGSALLGLFGLPTFSAAPYFPVFPFNPPTWAIVLEFWALAVVCFWRLDRRPLQLTMLVVASIVAQAALSVAWRNFNMGWEGGSYLGGFTRAAFGFLGGLLLYRVVASFGARLPRVNAIVLWVGFASLLFVQIRFVALPLLFVVTPLMVMLGAVSSCPRSLQPLCVSAKRNAYAFYLLHYPVLVAYKALGPMLGASEWFMTSIASYATALVLTGLVVWLISHLVDNPTRRRLTAAAGA